MRWLGGGRDRDRGVCSKRAGSSVNRGCAAIGSVVAGWPVHGCLPIGVAGKAVAAVWFRPSVTGGRDGSGRCGAKGAAGQRDVGLLDEAGRSEVNRGRRAVALRRQKECLSVALRQRTARRQAT